MIGWFIVPQDAETGAARLACPAQERDEQHHRDDRQVLEDHQPQPDLTLRAVRLTTIIEQHQHDSRRTERNE